MYIRWCWTLLALLCAVLGARAQEHPCPVLSPGDPVNLKTPYQSVLSLLGLPCGPAPAPIAGLPCPTDGVAYQQWCGHPCDFWFSAEARVGFIKSGNLPPLAATGLPGQPGVVIALGNGDAGPTSFAGAQFTGGVWINYAQTFGLEGTYSFLAERRDQGGIRATGDQTAFFRPIVDVETGNPDVLVIGGPGAPGSLHFSLSTSFQQASGSAVFNLFCQPGRRVDALVGATYLELIDDLIILEDTARREDNLSGGVFGDGSRLVVDSFAARNRFYGGHVGVRGETQQGPWSGSLLVKLALGETQQRVGVTGVTRFPTNGTTTPTPGGVLANAGNLGTHDHDQFGVVPQIELKLGYQLCSYARITAGYGFTFWSDVARAGEQAQLAIDPRQLPSVQFPPVAPAASPRLDVKSSSFWVQGLGIGLEVRF